MSPKQKMTRDEEYDFDARPENQEPQGPPRLPAVAIPEHI